MAPKFLITCDPGIRECGVAVLDLEAGRLLATWLVKNTEHTRRGNGAWTQIALLVQRQVEERFPEATRDGCWAFFLGETPVVHKDNRSAREERVNPNQLFQTSGASGAVGARLVEFATPEFQHEVEADDWTGGVPKETRQKGWWEKQPKEVREAVTLPAPSYLNHVIDAVDMAFWFRRHWRLWVVRGCTGDLLPQKAKKKRAPGAARGRPRQARMPGLETRLKSATRLPTVPGAHKPYGQTLREKGLLPTPATRRPQGGGR